MFSSYSEIYHNCSEEFIIEKRLDLVHYANQFGIKACCRHFSCSKNTVKRWVRRYAVYGKKGLKNASRAPKKTNRKISQRTIDSIEVIVRDSEEKKKYITTVNVIKKLDLKENYFTINRYVRRFMKKRKRREANSENRSTEFKKDLLPFEIVQIDIKYLTDIAQLRPYFNGRNLAKYQITARDVCTGYTIVAYCYEKSLTNTYNFLKNIIYPFFKSFEELDLKKINVQSDNGNEFTNRNSRIIHVDKPVDSLFTKFINENFRKHRLIVPGHCTAQSEVESFHWTIEKDCLAWDDITDNKTLIECTTKFIKEFNNKKRFKKDYSPIEKISEYFDISKIKFPEPIIL